MIEFYAVVVLYNTFVQDSVTIKNLKEIYNHDISIIVLDNSTRDLNNEEETTKSGWTYISMHGNVGLSKAYNRALDYLKNEDGVVVWFDDDTNVTQEYFDELEKRAIEFSDVDIFMPVVQGQDGKFWSPNEARFFKNKQLKYANQSISSNKINAINSCTAVRLRVYESYRYDECLFLDQVDYNFFEDQRNQKRKFYTMHNVVIVHNFSLKNIVMEERELEIRYSLRIRDFVTYCRVKNKSMLMCRMKIFLWGLNEFKRTKNIKTLYFFCKKMWQCPLISGLDAIK